MFTKVILLQSYLSKRFAEWLGSSAVVLSTDKTRREMFEMKEKGELEREKFYCRENINTVYKFLLERSLQLLSKSICERQPLCLILDGTFLKRENRSAFLSALGQFGDSLATFLVFAFVEKRRVMEERIEERAGTDDNESDATVEVLRKQLEGFDEFSEEEEEILFKIDTYKSPRPEMQLFMKIMERVFQY